MFVDIIQIIPLMSTEEMIVPVSREVAAFYARM